jgi:hypothetical protein
MPGYTDLDTYYACALLAGRTDTKLAEPARKQWRALALAVDPEGGANLGGGDMEALAAVKEALEPVDAHITSLESRVNRRIRRL